MEEFPIWLKITIYATIGSTVLYTAWASFLQCCDPDVPMMVPAGIVCRASCRD